MKKNLRDTIEVGLCAYGAGIVRDGYGYGRVVKKPPGTQCQKICSYCRKKADYLASLIEEELNDCEQSIESLCRENRKA